MALTRSFKETVKERAAADPEFRSELLKEAINSLLAGDLATGKAVLRDFINATIGFEELAVLTNKSPKSLMRMLGPNGNPQAQNLLDIVARLQDREGLRLEVLTSRRA